MLEELKKFIISWGNTFPLDRWWRERYKIPFNSKAHLEANQADILIEYLETKIYDESVANSLESWRKKELYLSGDWLSKSKEIEKVSDDIFDKIDI